METKRRSIQTEIYIQDDMETTEDQAGDYDNITFIKFLSFLCFLKLIMLYIKGY